MTTSGSSHSTTARRSLAVIELYASADRNRDGDCEDFALLTAGLLRFRGVPVAVASVQSAAGYTYLKLTNKTRGEINYVPIDYDNVGRFSSAVAREYTVSNIWIPEEIYGWRI